MLRPSTKQTFRLKYAIHNFLYFCGSTYVRSDFRHSYKFLLEQNELSKKKLAIWKIKIQNFFITTKFSWVLALDSQEWIPSMVSYANFLSESNHTSNNELLPASNLTDIKNWLKNPASFPKTKFQNPFKGLNWKNQILIPSKLRSKPNLPKFPK